MPDALKPTQMQEHYARGLELERLAESTWQLKFERTKEIILRHLPSPPAVVADIGGGPGRYALWLGSREGLDRRCAGPGLPCSLPLGQIHDHSGEY
jgi:hypothetical protein